MPTRSSSSSYARARRLAAAALALGATALLGACGDPTAATAVPDRTPRVARAGADEPAFATVDFERVAATLTGTSYQAPLTTLYSDLGVTFDHAAGFCPPSPAPMPAAPSGACIMWPLNRVGAYNDYVDVAFTAPVSLVAAKVWTWVYDLKLTCYDGGSAVVGTATHAGTGSPFFPAEYSTLGVAGSGIVRCRFAAVDQWYFTQSFLIDDLTFDPTNRGFAYRPMPSESVSRSESITICAGQDRPAGYILVDAYQIAPNLCDNGGGFSQPWQYQAFRYQRYDDLKVGATIEACAVAPVPAGWVRLEYTEGCKPRAYVDIEQGGGQLLRRVF